MRRPPHATCLQLSGAARTRCPGPARSQSRTAVRLSNRAACRNGPSARRGGGQRSRSFEDLRHIVTVDHLPVLGVGEKVREGVLRRVQDPLDAVLVEQLQRILYSDDIEIVREDAGVLKDVGATVDEGL